MAENEKVNTSKPISRSDVRKAVIHGLKRTKSDPSSLRITEGQRAYITGRMASKSARRAAG